MGIRTCAVALALIIAVPGAAPEAKPVAPPAPTPPVMYIAQAVQAGVSPVDVGIVDSDGTRRVVLDDVASGTWGLATHPATGRFALTFLQGSNGDPLILDGATVSKPSDLSVIVFGDAAHGVSAHLAGDPKCTNRKTACFQSQLRFSDDGAQAFIQSEASRFVTINRWFFDKPGKPALIATGDPASLQVSSDGTQLAYLHGTGIAITAWPTQPTNPKRKAVRVKAGKVVASPNLLMSDAWLIQGALYYFRREPTEQKRGYLEVYDLATRASSTVIELPDDFPMWRHRFLYSRSRQGVIFAVDNGFERATLYEAALTDHKPRAVVADAHALLDISADGRYALMSAYRAVAKGNTADNPEDLWIVDLSSGAVIKRDLGVTGARVLAARFVGP